MEGYLDVRSLGMCVRACMHGIHTSLCVCLSVGKSVGMDFGMRSWSSVRTGVEGVDAGAEEQRDEHAEGERADGGHGERPVWSWKGERGVGESTMDGWMRTLSRQSIIINSIHGRHAFLILHPLDPCILRTGRLDRPPGVVTQVLGVHVVLLHDGDLRVKGRVLGVRPHWLAVARSIDSSNPPTQSSDLSSLHAPGSACP